MTDFHERVLEIEPFAALGQDAATWDDAIVFVLAGAIDVVCADGEHERFRGGDILCLAPFPVRVVRNAGSEVTRLLLVSRRSG